MVKSCWLILATAATALYCPCAEAGTKPIKDPIVIIAGGGGSLPLGNIFQILSPSGSSPLNLLGGSSCVVAGLDIPDCIFQNSTSSTWSALTFSISPANQIGPFTCLALTFFSKCSFNRDGTSVTFSGGKGINTGQDFLVAVVLWLPGTIFAGTATEAKDSAAAVGPSHDALTAGLESDKSRMPMFPDGQVALVYWRRLQTASGSRV